MASTLMFFNEPDPKLHGFFLAQFAEYTHPEGGLVIIFAELFGPSGSAVLRLALDTGATATLVNVGHLVAVGYDPSLGTERVQVTTGSGVEFAPRIRVSLFKTLGQERASFPILR